MTDVTIRPRNLVRGATKVRRALGTLGSIPELVLARQRIERLIVRRTRERFAPEGANPRAQKSPQGVPWAPLSRLTPLLRSTNKGGKDQALVDTGLLRSQIGLVRGRLEQALRSPTGASAFVGVTGSRKDVGRLHQFGGTNDFGFPVPARPFLGIGNDDVKAVQGVINRIVARAEARATAEAR